MEWAQVASPTVSNTASTRAGSRGRTGTWRPRPAARRRPAWPRYVRSPTVRDLGFGALPDSKRLQRLIGIRLGSVDGEHLAQASRTGPGPTDGARCGHLLGGRPVGPDQPPCECRTARGRRSVGGVGSIPYAGGRVRVVPDERPRPGSSPRGTGALVVEFLGLVIFATIVGIGLLDVKSGLSPFAMYRSAAVISARRRASAVGHGGDDNQPRPPTPAR